MTAGSNDSKIKTNPVIEAEAKWIGIYARFQVVGTKARAEISFEKLTGLISLATSLAVAASQFIRITFTQKRQDVSFFSRLLTWINKMYVVFRI